MWWWWSEISLFTRHDKLRMEVEGRAVGDELERTLTLEAGEARASATAAERDTCV